MGLVLKRRKNEELETAMAQRYPLPSNQQFGRVNTSKVMSSYQHKINRLQAAKAELTRIVLKRKKQASFDHELIFALRKQVGDVQFYQLVNECKHTRLPLVTIEEQAYGNCLKCKQFTGLVGYAHQLCSVCMLKTGWKYVAEGVWTKDKEAKRPLYQLLKRKGE